MHITVLVRRCWQRANGSPAGVSRSGTWCPSSQAHRYRLWAQWNGTACGFRTIASWFLPIEDTEIFSNSVDLYRLLPRCAGRWRLCAIPTLQRLCPGFQEYLESTPAGWTCHPTPLIYVLHTSLWSSVLRRLQSRGKVRIYVLFRHAMPLGNDAYLQETIIELVCVGRVALCTLDASTGS